MSRPKVKTDQDYIDEICDVILELEAKGKNAPLAQYNSSVKTTNNKVQNIEQLTKKSTTTIKKKTAYKKKTSEKKNKK